jgi:hypothetical protein
MALAAAISCSTSASGRCSRVRSSAFGRRVVGVTVRFCGWPAGQRGQDLDRITQQRFNAGNVSAPELGSCDLERMIVNDDSLHNGQ